MTMWGVHDSTHDLALKSLIEDQVRSHCKSRGLDFDRLTIGFDGQQLLIEMKDGSDARQYLQLKLLNSEKVRQLSLNDK